MIEQSRIETRPIPDKGTPPLDGTPLFTGVAEFMGTRLGCSGLHAKGKAFAPTSKVPRVGIEPISLSEAKFLKNADLFGC